MGWIKAKDGFPALGEIVVINNYLSISGKVSACHPNRFAYLFETALCGKKWMVQCNDSGGVYILDLDEVLSWMPLTNKGE